MSSSQTPQTPAGPAVPRVPPPVDGIDVNFCRNPTCGNFGVPIPGTATRGPGASNPYTVVATGRKSPAARCNVCGETFTLKSNAGVAEETRRILSESFPRPSCPDPLCSNHRVPVGTSGAFVSIGKTKLGSARYRCKACGGGFSVKPPGLNPIRNQRQSDKNRSILSMLTNKMPLRRICEAADVSPRVLYERIDFFHEQALAFLADRERNLSTTAFPRLYVGVDRQMYAINWSGREDKRNVVLEAVASADNGSGYVFGMHSNFDPAPNPKVVEQAALAAGDHLLAPPRRRFARLWLQSDFDEAVRASRRQTPRGGVDDAIRTAYANAVLREDSESSDTPSNVDRLPESGMLVHSQYTLHGHFMALRRLLDGAEKVRFFLDQESGIRGACIGAFVDRILDDRCEAFYVRIAKELTVDEKRKLIKEAAEAFERAKAEFAQDLAARGIERKVEDDEVKLELLKQRIAEARAIGPWSDRWVAHPLPTISEPEKAICHLTDRGQYAGEPDHLAWLYNKASLHAVDSFFNRVRRRFVMLERPLSSQANRGRVWNGYSAYRPEQIAKLLTIARACHNYVWTGDKKKGVELRTPAMRLGLARAPLDLSDIIYFR